MTETQLIVLSSIIAYFAFLIWVGYSQGKKQDHLGFVIGGRNVGLIPTIGSLASGFRDGAGIVLWITFAYTVGYGGMWAFLGILCALIIIAFIGPKVRALSIERDYITIGQMLREQIGKSTDRITALIILVFALLAMALQMSISGNLLASFVGQPEWVGLVAVGLVVMFYLFEGGYGSVVKTDAIQFFIILALVATPFFMDVKKEDVMAFETITSMGSYNSIALFLIGLFLPFGLADNWQRVFSARNDKVIRYGFPLAGVGLIIMTLTLILIGYGLKGLIPAEQKEEIIYIMFREEVLSSWLLAYMGVTFMAITMSTLDTQTYLFTSTILKDYIPQKYTEDREQYIKLSRIVIVLAIVLMALIALTINDVIQFMFEAMSLTYIMGPVILCTAFGWFKRSTALDLYITANIAICVTIYIYMMQSGMMEDLMMTVVPAGISCVGCLIGVILSLKFFDSSKEAKS